MLHRVGISLYFMRKMHGQTALSVLFHRLSTDLRHQRIRVIRRSVALVTNSMP